MKINKKELKEIFNECTKELIEEHVNIVRNFNSAAKIIEQQWTSPDDFWWVKIEQRYKDFRSYNGRRNDIQFKFWKQINKIDGTDRENHVGYAIIRGNSKESAVKCLKNITVHLNPWAAKSYGQDIVTSEGNSFAIIDVCNLFYARAYMTINKRSLKTTVAKARDSKSKGMFKMREFHHAAGQMKVGNDGTHNWEQERPWTLIDCDIDDTVQQQKLEQFLADNGIKIDGMDMSHDGKHYYISDPRVRTLDFSPFLNAQTNNRPGDPAVLAKGDASMLLYSPCGI